MKSLTLIRGAVLTGSLMLLHVPAAVAAGGSESTPLNLGSGTAAHVSSGSGSSMVRTIVGLFIVIAVIYGITWILRQAKGGKSRASGSGLTQLANLPLGGGRSVALVRAGREVLLVGVAEHGVTPIRTYTEAEAIASGIELGTDEPMSADRSARMVDVLRRMTIRS